MIEPLHQTTEAYGLSFMYPRGDAVIGQALERFGEFAKPEVDLLSAYMTALPHGTFLDVGANIGSIALPLAQNHPQWRVTAYEAHRGLAGLLVANALNNNLTNVEAHHAAVGPAIGVVAFPTPPLSAAMNFGSIGFGSDAPPEPVRMCTLDSVAPADTRLIKLDVEGAEGGVLMGSATLLTTNAIWLFEAKKGSEKTPALLNRFISAGFRLHWFYAPFVTPNSAKAQNRHGTGDYNCLALPPGVPDLWQLPAITSAQDIPPSTTADFAYLSRYGF
jgi:FkbM family methyltransferase